mgnify:FL=1
MALFSQCPWVPAEAYLIADPLDTLPPLHKCQGRIAGRRKAVALAEGQTTVAPALQDRITAAVFGRVVAPREFEHACSGQSRSGVPALAKVKKISASKPVDGVFDCTVTMELRIGKHKGRILHQFFRQGTERAGYLKMFDLSEGMPKELGQGVGESVWRNALQWQMLAGVGSSRLHAEWVGRYVWATFGYNWDFEDVPGKREELSEYLEPRVRRGALMMEGAALTGAFQHDSWPPFKQHITRLCDRAWNVASLQLAAPSQGGALDLDHVGKRFLMGEREAVGSDDEELRYKRGEPGVQSYDAMLVPRPGHPTFERAKVRLGL